MGGVLAARATRRGLLCRRGRAVENADVEAEVDHKDAVVTGLIVLPQPFAVSESQYSPALASPRRLTGRRQPVDLEGRPRAHHRNPIQITMFQTSTRVARRQGSHSHIEYCISSCEKRGWTVRYVRMVEFELKCLGPLGVHKHICVCPECQSVAGRNP